MLEQAYKRLKDLQTTLFRAFDILSDIYSTSFITERSCKKDSRFLENLDKTIRFF